MEQSVILNRLQMIMLKITIKGLLVTLVMFSLVFLYAGQVNAEIFQYFDEDGTLIVTDNPFGLKRKRTHTEAAFRELRLDLKENISYDYYTVYGKTFEDAVMSTRINGPFDTGKNRQFAARTEWRLGLSYSYDSSYRIEDEKIFASLNLHAIVFKSDITVLLPGLSESSVMSGHELIAWEAFVKGLLDHEHDHVRIVQDASQWDKARLQISELRELTIPLDKRVTPDAAIKRAVEAETARISHNLIIAIKAANEEYDRITDHGLKQEMRTHFFAR